MIYLNIT